MRYFERLPIVAPGTLVASSLGIASYITTGYLVDKSMMSRPMMQLIRNGHVFVELSDEWIGSLN